MHGIEYALLKSALERCDPKKTRISQILPGHDLFEDWAYLFNWYNKQAEERGALPKLMSCRPCFAMVYNYVKDKVEEYGDTLQAE